jgi:hypothetical protein
MKLFSAFLLIFALVLAWSCTPRLQRRENTLVRKVDRLKVRYADVWKNTLTERVVFDTIIPPRQIDTVYSVYVDSAAVDSLASRLADAIMQSDGLQWERDSIVARLRRLINSSAPGLIMSDTLFVEKTGVQFKSWYAFGKIHSDLYVDSARITLVKYVEVFKPEYVTKKIWAFTEFWVVLLLLVATIAFVVIRR